MGFPRQEYMNELPFPFPGDLSDPEIEPVYPALAGKYFTTEPPGETLENIFLLFSPWVVSDSLHVRHDLLEFAHTHVGWIGGAI